jgi:hypothetical protein
VSPVGTLHRQADLAHCAPERVIFSFSVLLF